VKRKVGRANILRRIEELESRSVDGSGLVLHSPAWLEFWMRQDHLIETGQEHVRFTLEGARAVMQATPDNYQSAESETPEGDLAPIRS
jgi:hypothetical protein